MVVNSRYRPAELRHRWLQGLLAAGFVIILGRLFQLQVVSRQYYVEEVAAIIDSHKTPVGPQPGALLARDLQPLGESLLLKTCVANPRLMAQAGESLQGVAEELAPVIGRPEDELYKLLYERRDKAYVEMASFLQLDVAQRIADLKIKGLDLQSEWKREYPQGILACHVVGGRDRFHRPRAGLEHLYAALLDPEPGVANPNRGGSWAAVEVGCRPEPGKDLVLTIDLGLQRQVERELDAIMDRERNPDWVCAVVLDSQSGEVLAIGSRPGYDPNCWVEPRPTAGCRRTRVTERATRNIPVTAAVEQGSTFKVLLIAAALDAGVVRPETTLRCSGHINIGGRPISCWGRYGHTGHGDLNMYGMVGQSCNCIAAQVAQRLGAKRYHEFLQKVGIGVDPEAGFPAEALGLLPAENRIPPRDLATMGFGQNVSCSGLQLAAAVAGIANDGVMQQPHILMSALNADGSVFARPPVRATPVCSAATSAIVRDMLKYTVEHGTGGAVQMPDFAVGGKTGTAQEWDFEHHRHFDDRYMMSFIEVAPIDKPRYVIYVACNDPHVGEHGSDVAAPSCKRIAEYLLHRRDRVRPETGPAAAPAANTH